MQKGERRGEGRKGKQGRGGEGQREKARKRYIEREDTHKRRLLKRDRELHTKKQNI